MICKRCKEERDEADFYYRKVTGEIIHPCKPCCKEIYQRDKNGRLKEYNEKNKDVIKERNKKRYWNNVEKSRKLSNDYYYNNKEERLKKDKEYREIQKKTNPEYYPKRRLQEKKYRDKNKEKIKERRRVRVMKKYYSDPTYKTLHLLKCRLLKAVKRNKVKSAKSLLGCTSEEVRAYLESKFLPEMNWENHGKIWEIDHIVPCITFDMSKLEDQEKCFHYTNLQPLFKTTKIAESFGYKDYVGNLDKARQNFKN